MNVTNPHLPHDIYKNRFENVFLEDESIMKERQNVFYSHLKSLEGRLTATDRDDVRLSTR